MEETVCWKKRHPHLWRLMILGAVIVSAWLLGQLLGAAIIKAMFL